MSSRLPDLLTWRSGTSARTTMLPLAPPSWMPTIGTPWLRSGATALTPRRMGSTSAPADAPDPVATSTPSTASTRASCSTRPTPANTARCTPGSSRRQRAKRPTCSTDPHAHRTSLRIVEHYTDTAGATDHVFGLCHLLGYCFAPRIKDLKERKLYAVEKPDTYLLLKPLIGDAVDTAALVRGWAELMRVKASIEAGAVAPSTILRKIAAAGSNNALSRALRALGRIERTLFTLQWLSDPALRQRSHAGLNKGEASNSLRRAVFFHRQGEFRDRTFENQSFRASGLSLLTAAIIHWNTTYLDCAVQHLRAQGVIISNESRSRASAIGTRESQPTACDRSGMFPPRSDPAPLSVQF